jgi:hypothetical protein
MFQYNHLSLNSKTFDKRNGRSGKKKSPISLAGQRKKEAYYTMLISDRNNHM